MVWNQTDLSSNLSSATCKLDNLLSFTFLKYEMRKLLHKATVGVKLDVKTYTKCSVLCRVNSSSSRNSDW